MIRNFTGRSILLSLSLCSAAAACPLCRDSAPTSAGSGGGTPPAALFNSSIVVILAALVVVITFLIAKIVAAIRLSDQMKASQSGARL